MKKFFIKCAATVALIGCATMGAAIAYPGGLIPNDEKRPGAGKLVLIPQSSDEIKQWDPNAPHYWLVEVIGGSLRIVDDYEAADDCWNATFWKDGTRPAETPEQSWRACLPLDEPAEGMLAEHIVKEMGMVVEGK